MTSDDERGPDVPSGTGTEDATHARGAADDRSGPTVDGTDDGPKNVWTRWDRAGEGLAVDHGTLPIEDLHLHRYCDVGPFRSRDDGVDASDGRGGDPGDGRLPRAAYKWFIPGSVLRTGLRQTPLVVLGTIVVFVASAELSPAVGGPSAFLPAVDPLIVAGVGALGVVYLVLLRLLVDVGVLDRGNLVRAAVVYGVLSVLVVGTAGSVYLVVTSDDPTALEPNVIYTSGYLLMLFLGGLLVYDGMIRTEHLFLHLPETLIVDEDERFASGDESDPCSDRDGRDYPCPPGTDNRAYHAFITDLRSRLEHRRGWIPVPSSHLFALFFTSQFATLWVVGIGPQNLDFPVTLVANVLLDLFVVILAFQFLVLVDAMYKLVEGGYDVAVDRSEGTESDTPAADGTHRVTDEVSALTYRPFHPDGHGGFRDIGKFATRVNLLLIMAGLYTVYRLYVQGMRVTPAETVSGLPLELGAAVWFVSYVVPVLAYVVAAGAWLYYSFWHLHLRMARERERQYIERKAERGYSRVGDFEDATDWIEKRNAAPTWPVDSRRLASIVSGTIAPVLLSVPNFVV